MVGGSVGVEKDVCAVRRLQASTAASMAGRVAGNAEGERGVIGGELGGGGGIGVFHGGHTDAGPHDLGLSPLPYLCRRRSMDFVPASRSGQPHSLPAPYRLYCGMRLRGRQHPLPHGCPIANGVWQQH